MLLLWVHRWGSRRCVSPCSWSLVGRSGKGCQGVSAAFGDDPARELEDPEFLRDYVLGATRIAAIDPQ